MPKHEHLGRRRRPAFSRPWPLTGAILALLSITVAAGCASQAPREFPTTIEGTYTATITRGDAIAGGIPIVLPDLIDENTGDFTLTLEDGHVTMLQTASHHIETWTWLATYTVSGDLVTFVKPDTQSARKFRWSLDQGDLTLTFLSIDPPNATLAEVMTAIFESHPWKRVYQAQSPALP